MTKIAVFVSGSGSDMQSIIDAIVARELDASIELVVASKADIFALERAKTAGLKAEVYCKSDFLSLELMYDKLIKHLHSLNVEYIVLAGYLTILTPNIIKAFEHHIINIHPSLIPKYCGMGMYGMKVHSAVIANREKVSGATVHFVDEGADTGEIIAQETVPVYPNDMDITLQKRVLELEHILLPKTLKSLFNKEKE